MGGNVRHGRKTGLDRRSLLRGLACAAALPLFAGGKAMAEIRKLTQAQASYREQAQGLSLCGDCKYFQPPSACAIVEGTISASGWCSKYAKSS